MRKPDATETVTTTNDFISNHIQHYLKIIKNQPNQIFETENQRAWLFSKKLGGLQIFVGEEVTMKNLKIKNSGFETRLQQCTYNMSNLQNDEK